MKESVDDVQKIWAVDGDSDSVYIEGYSTAKTPEDSEYRKQGMDSYGWFCMETDSWEEAKAELKMLGFTDKEIKEASHGMGS